MERQSGAPAHVLRSPKDGVESGRHDRTTSTIECQRDAGAPDERIDELQRNAPDRRSSVERQSGAPAHVLRSPKDGVESGRHGRATTTIECQRDPPSPATRCFGGQALALQTPGIIAARPAAL